MPLCLSCLSVCRPALAPCLLACARASLAGGGGRAELQTTFLPIIQPPTPHQTSRPLPTTCCDRSIAATRRWMEPSGPLSPPSHDAPAGHAVATAAAAGAPKLGLDTATSPGRRSASSASPATSPPYWVRAHQRSFSNISVESTAPGAITLEDNDNVADVRNQACWAKSVHIDDYVVVNGNRTGIGAFIVWTITVETLRVSQAVRPPGCWICAACPSCTSKLVL